MPKLCEIIAIVKGKKGAAEAAVTDVYHKFQKGDLFDGLQKTYRPYRVDADPAKAAEAQLPPESKQPQLSVKSLISDACKVWRELFDLTLTLDVGDAATKADVTVGGKTILTGVPVVTLLFLEKQLENIATFISKIPTPNAAKAWAHSDGQDMLATEPEKTVRTKKEQRALVMYDATKEHPAQTQLITEDVPAGEWSLINYTTRLPAKERNEMLERVAELQDAVKSARERANTSEIIKLQMGEQVLKHVFGGLAAAR